MISKTFRLLAGVGAAALAFSALPAEAQRVTRIVAIGDSYLDDGNVFELTGTPRPAIYPNGRFSNGTNLIDTMSLELGVPVLNYGVGGAVARAQNTPLPQVQALDLQVNSFLAGGGPPAFPRSSGSFAPGDLLVVNIGANDARAYERSLGLSPTAAQIAQLQAGVPAQAQLTAGDAIRNLDRLVGAGVQQMTVLGGDVGRLPEVRGLPIAAVGTAYSTAFNTLIQQRLSTYAQGGVIVNYLDLNKIGDVLENNLAAFGLTSVTAACPTACVTTNPELLDRYFFYVDALHLTSRGFEIVGQYAVRQLEAPLQLEAQGDVAVLAADSFGSALSDRLDLSAYDGAAGLRVFLGGSYGRLDRPASATSYEYTASAGGFIGGVEYGGGNFLVGIAGSYSRPDVRLQGDVGGVEGDALQGGVYGAARFGGAFVEAFAGIGRIDLEADRAAVIDRISGETEGETVTAGGEVGYLFGLGGLEVGPVAGLRYARATVEGYTETGDPVLTNIVGEQELDRFTGHVGVEARGNFDVGGLAVRPFVTAVIEDELGEDDEAGVSYAGTASPTIVNRFNFAERDSGAYGRLSGGVSFDLSRRVALQVAASTTVSREQGEDAAGSLAVRFGF